MSGRNQTGLVEPPVRKTKRTRSIRTKDVPAVVRLLEHARLEILPTATIEEKVLASVPTDVQLTVTASPTKGLDQTFDLAERFAGAGYDVVPHIAARMVSGRSELEEIVARLTAFGVSTVFVPGGDADPIGDYADSLSLIEDLTALGNPFPNVGITGYPESHPTILDDVAIQAMWDKRRHATHIVSNMTFDSKAVRDWLHRLRQRGVTLPVVVGLPGPIDRTKLLAMATKIGIGDSTKFLTKHKSLMARLSAPGGFTGEKFLEQCASAFGDPAALVKGLHLYTFNQVAETEQWRQQMLGRLRMQQ